MAKLGFIGCGNMARAMLSGIIGSGVCGPRDIIVSAKSRETMDYAESHFGVSIALDNADVLRSCDTVVLAVKPQMFEDVLSDLRFGGAELAGKMLVSLAPGKSIAWLQANSGIKSVVRLMPNTPARIGEGMTSVTPSDECTPAQIAFIMDIVNSFGRGVVVAERLIDTVVAVSGSSPAFVYMFIEAMADAAVLEGMPRAQAYQFAAQAVAGSAKMVLETGENPGSLKDAVCSPSGTTIEGVRILEQEGFRGTVIKALCATAEKSKSM